jgi:putative ATPase
VKDKTQTSQDKLPLAYRMRPRQIKEFVGQEEVVGPGTVLRSMIETDSLTSLILYGPPGTGKTSLAAIIANTSKNKFVTISAVTSGVKEVRKLIEEARELWQLKQQRTILFIDEIHRFNKAQQDVLLPSVEDKTILLIGATTENPFFEVNSPLISRSRIVVLKPLTTDNLKEIISQALRDCERGLGKLNVHLQPEALAQIINYANGDARRALSALEIATNITKKEGQKLVIDLETAKKATDKRQLIYGLKSNAHYDTISAFIKSMRGSDPDAALYWLARMIYAGEDPKFIARRMVIFASEDIGNADPRALQLAVAAAQSVQFVGLPECRLNLAQAAIYLSVAPKSNAVIKAINQALIDVEKQPANPVPKQLRDSHYPGAKKLGHGEGYKYPHDFPGHWVRQSYLPDDLSSRYYYQPSNSGLEKKIKAILAQTRKQRKHNSKSKKDSNRS